MNGVNAIKCQLQLVTMREQLTIFGQIFVVKYLLFEYPIKIMSRREVSDIFFSLTI